jgi:hypothetical protein
LELHLSARFFPVPTKTSRFMSPVIHMSPTKALRAARRWLNVTSMAR